MSYRQVMIKSLLIICFFNSLLTVSVFAMSMSKTLVVGVEDLDYYPLFDFKNNRATYTKELLDEFASQHNYQIQYVSLPVKRFSLWLLENDIDVKFPDNPRWNQVKHSSKKQFKNLVYSEPALYLAAGTITKTDTTVSKKSDIKLLGTMLGFQPTKWVEEIKEKKVKLYESSSTLSLIRQLVAGQLDGLDIDPSVVTYYAKRINAGSDVALNLKLPYDIYSYHLSTISRPDIIKDFNVFLQNNAPFINELKAKYNIYPALELKNKLDALKKASN
jgi:polar amino acid transport system substrate-binding protein